MRISDSEVVGDRAGKQPGPLVDRCTCSTDGAGLSHLGVKAVDDDLTTVRGQRPCHDPEEG